MTGFNPDSPLAGGQHVESAAEREARQNGPAELDTVYTRHLVPDVDGEARYGRLEALQLALSINSPSSSAAQLIADAKAINAYLNGDDPAA